MVRMVSQFGEVYNRVFDRAKFWGLLSPTHTVTNAKGRTKIEVHSPFAQHKRHQLVFYRHNSNMDFANANKHFPEKAILYLPEYRRTGPW